jgi:branched-chain amino acid transport system permease protein
VLFLLFYLIRGGALGQESAGGGALDAAIRAEGGERMAASAARIGALAQTVRWYSARSIVGVLPLVVIALLPALFSGYWLGLIARGLALAIVLLSFSLVTGDGGMLWLCQITFAGGGALIAAELSSKHGVDPIVAALIGAVVMAPVGVLIGALTIRLGDLYVALVTLSFGLLVDTVVFSSERFNPGLGGVDMARPAFAGTDRSSAYFALAVFLIIGVVIVNLRRSTTGLAISAIRWSEPAAKTLGLKVVRIKLMLSGVAAFVAGLGGAVLAMYDLNTDTLTYTTFGGLVWLAVLVTVGVRSLTAALIAGLAFMLLPAVFSTYLSTSWLQVPALLFGLGAVGLAVNPEGVVAIYARYAQDLLFGRFGRGVAATEAIDETPPDAISEVLSAAPTVAPDSLAVATSATTSDAQLGSSR